MSAARRWIAASPPRAGSLHVAPRWRGALGFWSACFVLLAMLSCAMLGGEPLPPVQPQASVALEEARALLREAQWSTDPAPARERARQALLRASALEPDWVAPRRLFDELERADLRGPQRYADYLERLAGGGRSAALLYLLGRWEGVSGLRRFEAARALEPSLAWVPHAFSVDGQLRGRLVPPLDQARRAYELSRGSYERSFFGRRLVLLMDRVGRKDEGDALIAELLDVAEPGSVDQVELRVEQLRREFLKFKPEAAERAFQKLLTLLSSVRLTPVELDVLLRGVRSVPGRSELSREHLLREALLAGPNRAWLDGLEDELFEGGVAEQITRALQLSERPTARDLRIAKFSAGQPRAAVLEWFEALPSVSSWGDGERPLASSLEALHERARSSTSDPRELTGVLVWVESCLQAGWVAEAQALIAWALEEFEADLGSETVVDGLWPLQRRASAARALLAEMDRLVGSLANEAESWAATPLIAAEEGGPLKETLPEPESLDDVLDRLARLVELYGPDLGWDVAADAEAIRKTPLLSFNVAGRLTVPGEVFHERDELLGAGEAGQAVPGIPEVLARLGRMGLFGDAVGRAPDGTVLQRLWSGPAAGEHLGVPWSGTVIVCEGADADGARSRGAGEVAGAALHEGYWIDIEPERRGLERWRRLETERYRALDTAGVARLCEANVVSIPRSLRGEPGQRARLLPVLGAGDRLRLALIAERASCGEQVQLAELVEVTAVHEEGHLLDRTRFLPIGRNLGLAWGLLARAGLDALGVERRLEFRAQAIALACCSEPRLPLIQLLDAAEVDARRPTVHAAAYSQLLAEFLRVLDARLEADSEFAPGIDPEAYLVHQLHRLDGSEIRAVAEDLARAFGLDRR